jgi:hypothetical protein
MKLRVGTGLRALAGSAMMSMRCAGRARRSAMVSALALAILTVAAGNGALGSPGCDAVNAKAFDDPPRGPHTVSGL